MTLAWTVPTKHMSSCLFQLSDRHTVRTVGLTKKRINREFNLNSIVAIGREAKNTPSIIMIRINCFYGHAAIDSSHESPMRCFFRSFSRFKTNEHPKVFSFQIVCASHENRRTHFNSFMHKAEDSCEAYFPNTLLPAGKKPFLIIFHFFFLGLFPDSNWNSWGFFDLYEINTMRWKWEILTVKRDIINLWANIKAIVWSCCVIFFVFQYIGD